MTPSDGKIDRGLPELPCADVGPCPRSPEAPRLTLRAPFNNSDVGLLPNVTYVAWHPFKREFFEPIPDWDDPVALGPVSYPTWVPGWRYEPRGPEDVEEVWDGEGEQLRTVVSTHRPGPKYPERVFYVRQWRDPDGNIFGKTALRMTTAATFRRWLRGERWPRFSPAYRAHQRWGEAARNASPQGNSGTNPNPSPPGPMTPNATRAA